MEKFVISRKAFSGQRRPDLPMIRWTKAGAEIDPTLLTPENLRELEDELFGTYADSEWVGGVHVYQFYRVTSATQGWLFQRTDCLLVWVRGARVEYKFCRPHRLGTSYW